jgi:hypothetical protein
VQRIAGDGTGDTRWKVPGVLDWSTGIYNPQVDISRPCSGSERSSAPPTARAPFSVHSGVAGHALQSQHPADDHNSPRFPGAGHGQSRLGVGALPNQRVIVMAKLRLMSTPDDRSVKLTIELSAQVHRDLAAYAEVFARQTGQKIEPPKLIGPMLARFMSTDRVFLQARREKKQATS